jgi:hypothetical protein
MSANYRLTHQTLVRLLTEHSDEEVRELFKPRTCEMMLEDIWRDLTGQQPDWPKDQGEFVEALFAGELDDSPLDARPTCTTVRVNGGEGVVIEMPEPEELTEAHMVLIEFGPPVRYFTLERANTDDEPPATMLCEWKVRGPQAHGNYGGGPAPDVQAFIRAVEALSQV